MTKWTDYVWEYAKEHDVSFKEAMKLARSSYKQSKSKPLEDSDAKAEMQGTEMIEEVESDEEGMEEGKEEMGGGELKYREVGRFPPKSRKLLAKVGDEKIRSLTVERSPLSIGRIINWMTFGYYDKAVQKTQPFDSMFHLRLIINKKYMVQKNEVLEFSYAPRLYLKDTMTVHLPRGFDMTINELLDNTKKAIGPKKFSRYDAVYLNCQIFVKDILKSNGLLTKELNKFIVQNVKSLFDQFPPFIKKIVSKITRGAAKFDRVVQGEGMRRKSS